MKPKLTTDILKKEAVSFCKTVSKEKILELYGITDGKTVGTFMELKFQLYLSEKYEYIKGNSAKGIDMPSEDLNVDNMEIENGANKEDIIAILEDRNLPGDDISYNELAEYILSNPPKQDYLTISNALQWRLQYARIVTMSPTEGVDKLI